MGDDWDGEGHITMGEIQTPNENIPVGTSDAYRSGWDRIFGKKLAEAGVGTIPNKAIKQCVGRCWKPGNPYTRCELISGHAGRHDAGSPAFLFWRG